MGHWDRFPIDKQLDSANNVLLDAFCNPVNYEIFVLLAEGVGAFLAYAAVSEAFGSSFRPTISWNNRSLKSVEA